MFSPRNTSRCRWRRFPLRCRGTVSPAMPPDRHLVRTAIPFQPGQDSLGDFHPSRSVPLASFANRVSGGDQTGPLARGPRLLFPHPPASRKAGYVCTQRYGPAGPMHRAAGSSAASYAARNTTLGVRPRTRTGLHGNRVGVTMPLEIALSPQAFSTLPPSIHPKLGVSSKHQKFHRYALRRLFRSSLGNGRSD